jgi:hypothetical protein
MKMGILFSNLFWGIFLLVLGASFLVKVAFNIDIPVFRVFFGLFLVFLGIKVLLGRPKADASSVFGESRLSKPQAGAKYDVVFGKGVLDLRDMGWKGSAMDLESNTVFGHLQVKLDPDIPTLLRVSSAFSGARFPDGNVISFGEYSYRNKAYQEGQPCLTVKASVVFGSLEVMD